LSDPESISWYEHNASVAAQLYESVSFETVHDWYSVLALPATVMEPM
jgi:hypothetical protein